MSCVQFVQVVNPALNTTLTKGHVALCSTTGLAKQPPHPTHRHPHPGLWSVISPSAMPSSCGLQSSVPLSQHWCPNVCSSLPITLCVHPSHSQEGNNNSNTRAQADCAGLLSDSVFLILFELSYFVVLALHHKPLRMHVRNFDLLNILDLNQLNQGTCIILL